MSFVGKLKSSRSVGTEIFTLDEGRVTIDFPANLSSASLEDLKKYLDIFYGKTCRLTDDPVDEVDPRHFNKREHLKAQAAE